MKKECPQTKLSSRFLCPSSHFLRPAVSAEPAGFGGRTPHPSPAQALRSGSVPQTQGPGGRDPGRGHSCRVGSGSARFPGRASEQHLTRLQGLIYKLEGGAHPGVVSGVSGKPQGWDVGLGARALSWTRWLPGAAPAGGTCEISHLASELQAPPVQSGIPALPQDCWRLTRDGARQGLSTGLLQWGHRSPGDLPVHIPTQAGGGPSDVVADHTLSGSGTAFKPQEGHTKFWL